MQALTCPCCEARVYFENSRCVACGAELGFDPGAGRMRAVDADSRPCAHRTGAATCNWLLEPETTNRLCLSCRATRTIPDLTGRDAGARWARVEQAKRRLIHGLLRLGRGEVVPELRIDVLADPAARAGGPPSVVTGHAGGVITLNLEEADASYRERTRIALDEPYRTVLGHLRHETAHFLFGQLVAPDAERLAAFRTRFGDERADYPAALAAHYASPPPPGDPNHITPYAASHPHEDWAETVAHLMHLLDVVESAEALTRVDAGPGDPYVDDDAERLVARFVPVSATLNELNRAMGMPDAYPFVLSDPVVDKLDFALDVLRRPRLASGGDAVRD